MKLDRRWSAKNTQLYQRGRIYFVMRSSMLRGSRMNVGRVTLLKSAPGLSWEMMCPSTAEPY